MTVPASTYGLTEEQIRAGLRAAGVAPAAIERALTHQRRADARSAAEPTRNTGATPIVAPAARQAPPSPISLALPWSCVASDNGRRTQIGAHSAQYVAARGRAHDEAARQWPWTPHAGRVAVSVTVHAHDHRRRDIANLAKLLGDALAGVCYADDSQIDDWRITRGAPDVDRPRVELTIQESR